MFRFSGRTADDQVMTKCIKFLTLGPMSTSTPSFQQLHACGIINLHLWSILIHFSPSKQASVFITDIDWRDYRPQCVILDSSRHALYWKTKMKINWCFTYLLTYLLTHNKIGKHFVFSNSTTTCSEANLPILPTILLAALQKERVWPERTHTWMFSSWQTRFRRFKNQKGASLFVPRHSI